MNKKQKMILTRIIISFLLMIIIFVMNLSNTLNFVFYFVTYLIIGYDIIIKAFKGVLNLQAFDENFLMTIATIGVFVLALISNESDCFEAVAVMFFFQVGELFEGVAVRKSRKSIAELMDIRPDYANIEVDGKLKKVSPEEINIGDIIVVLPGEKIPIDGVVYEGNGSLNTTALTGESLPRSVSCGDEVFSGTVSIDSVIKIKTTKEFSQSAVSKILELVENASAYKSKTENFISRFAVIYTPIVCISAVVLAIVPPLVELLLGSDPSWQTWLYRSLSFLVVSCPCALVISIPLTFFAGIGGASREGILVKGANYLESLSKTKYVVFDKTGTLTEGIFKVNKIIASNFREDEILKYAAYAEEGSLHPIANSIKNAYAKNIDRTKVSNIKEISGHGIEALVDDHRVLVGNVKLMQKFNIDFAKYDDLGTIVHVAIDDKYAGFIVISDNEKTNAKLAISSLKKLGVLKTVMLTGDLKMISERIATAIGIDDCYSELLPQQKVSKLEDIISQKEKGSSVAFVGDGINDAPVLTRADIGIAMGAIGTDAAIEASDVVIIDDNLSKISKGIQIARKTLGIVKQNIYFTLFIKFGFLILCAIGLSGMLGAIFADVGVMILAVFNAMRALRTNE